MSAEHHYVYGSGMIGCLYDYGPNFCEDKKDAIDDLAFIFDSLRPREIILMRRALETDGIYYFRKPSEAGAHYCEVSKANGPCPESEES